MNALEMLFVPSNTSNKTQTTVSAHVVKVRSDMIVNKDKIAPSVVQELNKYEYGTKQRVTKSTMRGCQMYIAHSIFQRG